MYILYLYTYKVFDIEYNSYGKAAMLVEVKILVHLLLFFFLRDNIERKKDGKREGE